MGAIQLLSLGIIGEYLGRLFLEVKGRPIYVVEGVYDNGDVQAAEVLMDLKEEDILGADIGRHWYYRSKAAAPRGAWSAGSGPGASSMSARAPASSPAICWPRPARNRRCASTSAMPSDRDDSEGGKPVLYRRDTGPTDCDLVLMMDVLEHVDDDRGLVRHYAAKVPSGAHFLVTVPAFRFLWSGHDVFLEHKRRYRLSEIEAAMRDAGLAGGRAAPTISASSFPGGGGAAGHARRDRAQEQPEEARGAHQRHPDRGVRRGTAALSGQPRWRDCRPSCWRGSPGQPTRS